MSNKILAIIPARGGSKGLIGKNIMPLLGKPLLVWSIEQAKNSKYIDEIFVSTDDAEIAKTAENAGINVPVLRPPELARDDSPTIDTIFHVLDYYGQKGIYFDIVVLLEPTSPLRKINDIDDAIKKLLDNISNSESLVSVGEVHMENPYIQKKITNGVVCTLIDTSDTYYQRQQLPTAYFPYGVIYMSTVNALRKYKSFYQDNTIPYQIDRWQNYEIDDIFDFYCIEAIMKQKIKEIMK